MTMNKCKSHSYAPYVHTQLTVLVQTFVHWLLPFYFTNYLFLFLTDPKRNHKWTIVPNICITQKKLNLLAKMNICTEFAPLMYHEISNISPPPLVLGLFCTPLKKLALCRRNGDGSSCLSPYWRTGWPSPGGWRRRWGWWGWWGTSWGSPPTPSRTSSQSTPSATPTPSGHRRQNTVLEPKEQKTVKNY